MKYTALYERISRDDEQQGESNSIINQKNFLEEYANKNNFFNIKHFSDDGISGTTFDRLGFNEMIAEIEQGNVSVVICKDLSRLGRDYLKVGFYTEVLFKEKGVRFIAVNNGVDSESTENNDFTPFLNVINEFYCRDTSRKIKAIFKSKMEEGLRVSTSVPYGYYLNPNNKQQLLIDTESAEVVKRIFQMIIDGYTMRKIADILCEEEVLIPSAYWRKNFPNHAYNNYRDPYRWTTTAIACILKKREYMGHTILGKTKSVSYKSKKRIAVPVDEQLVFENTHEPIISEEMWNNAQRLRKTVRRTSKSGKEPHRLTGLLYCSDCGSKMTHRDTRSTSDYDSSNCYICSKYRQYGTDCTMHYIKTSLVEKLIFDTIRNVCFYVKENQEEYFNSMKVVTDDFKKEQLKHNKRLVFDANVRLEELDGLIMTLYETFANKKIAENHFQMLIGNYDKEQEQLKKDVVAYNKIIDEFSDENNNVLKFMDLVNRYSDFSELTTQMMNEFVEKVVVYNADKRGKDRVQKVDIYLNYIGNYEPPLKHELLLVEEQKEQDEKDKHKQEVEDRKRERNRIRARKYRADKKENSLKLEKITKTGVV